MPNSYSSIFTESVMSLIIALVEDAFLDGNRLEHHGFITGQEFLGLASSIRACHGNHVPHLSQLFKTYYFLSFMSFIISKIFSLDKVISCKTME